MNHALEFLTYLSRTPAPLSLIAQDMGVKQSDLRIYAARLVKDGIDVEITTDDGHYAAWIPPACWRYAMSAANQYWQRVHGD